MKSAYDIFISYFQLISLPSVWFDIWSSKLILKV